MIKGKPLTLRFQATKDKHGFECVRIFGKCRSGRIYPVHVYRHDAFEIETGLYTLHLSVVKKKWKI